MSEAIAGAFKDLIVARIGAVQARLNHCLDQIDTAAVWAAPAGANSIGLILQHLEGNLKQWALAALGGRPDTRERAREFIVERQRPLDEVKASVSATLDAALSVYRAVEPSRLLEPLVVQGMSHTVMSAMFSTVCHFEHHLGQITTLTKQALGGKYREYRRP